MKPIVVDSSNSCFEDYMNFSKLSKYELAALQKKLLYRAALLKT